MNSEKTIFTKRKGDEYIIHGFFVDDMMHIYSCDAMKNEFLALYKKDFDITEGAKMETFLGMVVEQSSIQSRFFLITMSKMPWQNMPNTSRRLCAPKRCQSLQVWHSRLRMSMSSPIRLNRSTIALCGKASVRGNIDLVQQFVRGIAVGTFLHISRYSSMGSAPPSDGRSIQSFQLQDHLSQRHQAS